MMRHRRAGLGGLAVLIILLLGLALAVAALGSIRSRGVTTIIRLDSHRDVCRELARFATTEATHKLRKRANLPDDSVFEMFRNQLDGPLPLLIAEHPLTQRELETRGEYSLDRLEFDAVVRLPASPGGLAFERRGVARVTAEVSGPEGTKALVETDYEYRTSMVVPPRPFGTPTLLVLAPDEVLAGANETIEAFLPAIPDAAAQLRKEGERLRTEAATWAALPGQVRTAIEAAIHAFRADPQGTASRAASRLYPADPSRRANFVSNLVGDPGRSITNFRAEVSSQVEPFMAHAQQASDSYQALAADLDTSAAGLRGIPAARTFPAGTSIFSLQPQLALAPLDLPTLSRGPRERARLSRETLSTGFLDLRRALASHTQRRAAAAAAFQALQVPVLPELDLTEFASSLSGIRSRGGAVAATDIDDSVAALLQVYVDFRKDFKTFGGAPQQVILDRLKRLAASERLARAHFAFGGPTAGAEASKFLQSHGPEGGVLLVDNQDVFQVSLEDVRGRLLLIVLGDVQVSRASVRDPTQDSITLVSYGEATIADDDAHISLILLGTIARLPRGTFTGNLVTTSLRGLSGTPNFTGELVYQEGLAGGPRNSEETAPVAAGARRTLLSPAPRRRTTQ